MSDNVLGYILLYISCTIASAGGIGGGGLNVPIFLVIFKFSYEKSVVLSLATVFGNYLIQVIINWRKVHPFNNSRPLIYWEAVLCLLPAQLGGSNIGVIISKILPDTLLLYLALLILIYAFVKTVKKGISIYDKETKELQMNPTLTYRSNNFWQIIKSLVSSNNSQTSYRSVESINNSIDDKNTFIAIESSEALLVIENSEKLSYIKKIQLSMFLIWLIYLSIYLSMNQTRKCSIGYFCLLLAIYPPLGLVVYYGTRYVAEQQKKFPEFVVAGDIDFSTMGFIPAVCAFIIGILCSLLGIGGGELMGPLLLQLKVIPQVSSATTSLMSLFNSSSNVLHYAIIGEIPYILAVSVFAIGIFGGLTGRLTAIYITTYLGRASVTIFMLSVVLLTSMILLVFDLSTSAQDIQVHSFC